MLCTGLSLDNYSEITKATTAAGLRAGPLPAPFANWPRRRRQHLYTKNKTDRLRGGVSFLSVFVFLGDFRFKLVFSNQFFPHLSGEGC